MKRVFKIAAEAFERFNEDDGWAISSHIALSALMAMFPFLIFVGTLAAIFGSKELADETVRLLLETWPKEVAVPLGDEIHDVLTNLRPDLLTFSVVLAIFFASSGVESLRIGLNRAYGVREERSWWLLRLESILYVLIGAAALLALSFLVVLYPLIWKTTVRYVPVLAQFTYALEFYRFFTATAIIVVALFVLHKWLPAGSRRTLSLLPGIAVTLALWLASGISFGRYLGAFAYTYVTYYAGLASGMIALVFLYFASMIFIYGGELNAAILRTRKKSPAKTRKDSMPR